MGECTSEGLVVAVWHRAGTSIAVLRACVQALVRHAGQTPFALVICNLDARTDASLGIVEVSTSIPIEVLDFDSPDVAPALNSVFARFPDADVVRVRSDVVVQASGWLDRLRTTADQNPSVGALGVRLLASDGRVRSLGRNLLGGLGVLPRAANRSHYEVDRYATRAADSIETIEVDSVSGAFAWYRCAAIRDAGGLDAEFRFELAEDDDFCLTARRLGFDVLVDPAVAAIDLSSDWSPTSYSGQGQLRSVLKQTKLVVPALWRAHAPYWLAKWGYDPRYPDLAEIRRLYGDTKICWRIGEKMAWKPSSGSPSVDIAIVTWNNSALLERCLRSLATTEYAGSIRVHVTDNGSSDDTLAVLEASREWLPFPLHVHDLAVNTGVTVGFNWSIVNGDAELVARLDDDVVLPADWLEKLVATMHRRPFAGCVGPKILNDNVRHTIQCGPFRMFPGTFGHTDEEDHGQVDFVARCSHVRGCCNLYRRDVLDAVGLFDLRYAPSQWDDPDHHMALWAAGYEVVYDGRVGIVHALTTGKGRTWAATSNQRANKNKLLGKWSKRCWQIVETALDLSRLGRLLPDDEAAWLASVPAAEQFPRQCTRDPNSATENEAGKLLRFAQLSRDFQGPMRSQWQKVVARARAMVRDRNSANAASLLQGLLDHTPTDPAALGLLAEAFIELAMPDEARRYLHLAQLVDAETDWSGLDQALAHCAQPRAMADVGDRSSDVGESRVPSHASPHSRVADSSDGLRVLMSNTFMPRTAGGDMVQVSKVAEHLREAGVQVDVRYRAHPRSANYDIAHVYNLWFPAQTLPQVRGIRTSSPHVPIALTPIYWDMAEKNWAELAIPVVYSDEHGAKRAAFLEGLASGELEIDGVKRADAQAVPFAGYHEYQGKILELVDWLLPQSEVETKLLRSTFGVETPHTLVTNGVESHIFEDADPEPFRRALGFAPGQEFVLIAGLVEVRKNQLLLLEALAGTGIHVVVVGRNYDPDYLHRCRQVGGDRVTFIEHLPHEMLASAMKAARVFALPSWVECAAIASLEAAVAGCQLVVGDRTSEAEIFGDAAYLCDPASVWSIRDAVLRAWKERDEPAIVVRRSALQRRLVQECSWRNAAVQTLQGYVGVLTRSGDQAAADKARVALELAQVRAVAGLVPA